MVKREDAWKGSNADRDPGADRPSIVRTEPLTHRALSARPEVGLLLPCNVTVEEVARGECLVRVLDAEAMMRTAGLEADPALAEVGREAGARLRRVAAALGG